MNPTSDQITLARSWIGTSETDEVFTERFARLGSLDPAILESMRSQLATMIFDSPAQATLDDGTSANFSANITALEKEIAKFLAVGGTDGLPDAGGGQMNVTRLTRSGRGR